MNGRGRRGFTLIELVVVLVIVALGTFLVVPMVEGGFDAREVRRAARQIASTVHHCRNEALQLGEPQAVVIDPYRNAIYTSDWGRWAVLTARAQIERIEGGRDLGDGTVQIVCFPNGSATGVDVVLSSRRDRTRERITIHVDPLLGMPRVL